MAPNQIQMSKIKVLVCGSSGFIGGHLVKRLRDEGFFVIGADIVEPQYNKPHIFYKHDLRNNLQCRQIFVDHRIKEVYNLACLMGGMGYIGNPEHSYDIMVGSSLIVANVLDVAIEFKAEKIFYSSSACVYNENLQKSTDVSLSEDMAYPAMPDLVYGWQKLFSEQMHQAAKDKIDIRIARFHNIFGPEGTYRGGKEKAPAAMCRKVIEAKVESFNFYLPPTYFPIDVWGSGNQTRSFLYIDDCIDAVRLLMESDFKESINIGSEEMISINGLAQMAIDISGKDIKIKNIPGPVGVMGRNSNNKLIEKVLGWKPRYTLRQGMEKTFNWINQQVNGL